VHVVCARDEADVGKLASSDVWALTEADENQRVWTDDYSNVLGAVYRRLRDGEQLGLMKIHGDCDALMPGSLLVGFVRFGGQCPTGAN